MAGGRHLETMRLTTRWIAPLGSSRSYTVFFVDFQGGRQLWLSGLVYGRRKRKWQMKCRSGGGVGGVSSLPVE